MLNPSLIGLTFLALSSFPPSCQTCHSLSQRRVEGGGGRGVGGACCASCLELHLLLCLLGLMATNFHKVQNIVIHAKKLLENAYPCSKCTFPHTQPPLHHFTHIKSLLWEGIDMGQSDVSSHSCQHSPFIYLVISSIVDLVTWSESGRCRSTSTPESPVRKCWETQACDLSHTYIWTQHMNTHITFIIPAVYHHCQWTQFLQYK